MKNLLELEIERLKDTNFPRFASKVKVDMETECWNWMGALNTYGYGRFQLSRTTLLQGQQREISAHRYAYSKIVGLIPEGLQLDHLCRNRSCCNPNHLEPVTPRENLLRGATIPAIHAAKTHCPRGHEYIAENTSIINGQRVCIACKRKPGGHGPYRRSEVMQKRFIEYQSNLRAQDRLVRT